MIVNTNYVAPNAGGGATLVDVTSALNGTHLYAKDLIGFGVVPAVGDKKWFEIVVFGKNSYPRDTIQCGFISTSQPESGSYYYSYPDNSTGSKSYTIAVRTDNPSDTANQSTMTISNNYSANAYLSLGVNDIQKVYLLELPSAFPT